VPLLHYQDLVRKAGELRTLTAAKGAIGEREAHEWAPARIWLQREQGEGGSHTWCEDSVGDGDLIEEVEYVRAALTAEKVAGEPESSCDPADICAGCRCKYNVYAAPQQTAQSTDDARAAVDFYAANPSAALVDFQKRFAPQQPAQSAEQDERAQLDVSMLARLSAQIFDCPLNPTISKFARAVEANVRAASTQATRHARKAISDLFAQETNNG
jgi:hypothetical protein